MVFTNTVKIAITSALGAVVVSSTLLFPLIKDINHSITKTNSSQDHIEVKNSKTVQVISKDQDNALQGINTARVVTNENPSIEMKGIHSENASGIQNDDTAVKSNILKEDIPHHKGN